jgi:hypothetical protein
LTVEAHSVVAGEITELSDDGPEFPSSAGLLVADLGADDDSEELLAELRAAAKR